MGEKNYVAGERAGVARAGCVARRVDARAMASDVSEIRDI